MTVPATLYGFPEEVQVRSLFYFLGAGFLAGVLYDALRMLRLAFSSDRAAVYLSDCLFAVAFAGMIFCTSMAVCCGELHFFMLLAAAAGFLVYYIALDGFVRRVTDRTVRILRGVFRAAYRVFSLPARAFARIGGGLCRIAAFFVKKIQFFLRKLLQKTKHIMYNNNTLDSGHGKDETSGNQNKGRRTRRMVKKNTKRKRSGFGRWTLLLLIVGIFAATVFTVYCCSMQRKIDLKKAELAQLQTQCSELEEENNDLRAMKARGRDEENMERIARENYGYVYPDEKVYVISP